MVRCIPGFVAKDTISLEFVVSRDSLYRGFAVSRVHCKYLSHQTEATQDAAQRVQYQNIHLDGYAFVPLSMKTSEQLDKPAMEFTNMLSKTVLAGGEVEKGT